MGKCCILYSLLDMCVISDYHGSCDKKLFNVMPQANCYILKIESELVYI